MDIWRLSHWQPIFNASIDNKVVVPWTIPFQYHEDDVAIQLTVISQKHKWMWYCNDNIGANEYAVSFTISMIRNYYDNNFVAILYSLTPIFLTENAANLMFVALKKIYVLVRCWLNKIFAVYGVLATWLFIQ